MDKSRWMLLVGVAILVMALAACGGDDTKPTAEPPTPTVESAGGFNPGAVGPALDSGPGLTTGTGVESGLPGCSDPNDTECPMPLVMELTETASAGGVTIGYPERYFVAETGAAEADVLITIVPSEKNVYEQKAEFEVIRAESVEAALAGLENPDSVAWSTGSLSGTVSVVKDLTQDPPVTTTIGAFELDGGGAVVLKLTTTGQYGWDLWSRLYEDMLGSLAVSG